MMFGASGSASLRALGSIVVGPVVDVVAGSALDVVVAAFTKGGVLAEGSSPEEHAAATIANTTNPQNGRKSL